MSQAEGTLRLHATTFYLYLLFLVYALSVTSIGPLMPELIGHYRLGLSGGGLFVTFRAIGGILAMLLGGALSDRTSKIVLIAACFVLFTAVLFAASAAPALALLYSLFFFLGASSRFMDMLANAYIADLHPERKERYLSLLHGFFGLGALIGPMYARLLIDSTGGWQKTYAVLGGACVVVVLVGIPAVITAPRGPTGGTSPKVRPGVLRSTDAWLLAFALALYVAHQSGLTVWLPLYMERHLGATKVSASAALSLFWAGIVGGRFLTSVLVSRIGIKRMLVWGHLTAGVLLCASVAARGPLVLMAGVTGAGLLTGAAYPLVVALACASHPERTGAVTSLLFISGTAARMVWPWVMGAAAGTVGLFPGILSTGLALFGVAALLLAAPGDGPGMAARGSEAARS